MADAVFKKARKKDKPAILALVRELDASDWVADEIDVLYAMAPGGLYVALVDDEPRAVCELTLPRPGEAGLAGMRVARSAQRQGIGSAFTRYMVDEAARLGAAVVRVMVEPDNKPSSALVTKLGFEPAAEWRVYHGLTVEMDDPASGVAVPGRRNLTQVRHYFTRSMRRSSPAGLMSLDTPWGDICEVTWSDVQQAVDARQVLLRHGKEGVEGALIFGQRRHEGRLFMTIRYFEGEKVAREHLLRHFSRLLSERGATVEASLPEQQALGLDDSLPGEQRSSTFTVYQLRPAAGADR